MEAGRVGWVLEELWWWVTGADSAVPLSRCSCGGGSVLQWDEAGKHRGVQCAAVRDLQLAHQ